MHQKLEEISTEHAADVQNPRGALAITLIYLLAIIAAWSFIYFTTIGRGGNQ